MDAWIWWIAAVAVGVFLVDLIVRVSLLTLVLPIFERRPPFNVRPSDVDPDAETVLIASTGGLSLAGSLDRPIDEPCGLIVFCPEFGGSHWSAPAYVGALQEAGYAVLAFDFRNQGQSDHEPGYAPTHWVTDREVDDVLAALRYAAHRDDLADLPVGIFGVSRGANAALAAAARSPRVGSVVTEGAFSTDAMMIYYAYRWAELYVPAWVARLLPEWHIAGTMRLARRVSGLRHGVRYTILERWLPRLAGRAALLITGGRDSYVAPEIAERLRRRIGLSCRPVWIVPGAKHNQARPTSPDEYDRRVTNFFNESLGVRPRESRERQRFAPVARYEADAHWQGVGLG